MSEPGHMRTSLLGTVSLGLSVAGLSLAYFFFIGPPPESVRDPDSHSTASHTPDEKVIEYLNLVSSNPSFAVPRLRAKLSSLSIPARAVILKTALVRSFSDPAGDYLPVLSLYPRECFSLLLELKNEGADYGSLIRLYSYLYIDIEKGGWLVEPDDSMRTFLFSALLHGLEDGTQKPWLDDANHKQEPMLWVWLQLLQIHCVNHT